MIHYDDEDGYEQEARVDAGDGLDMADRCGFMDEGIDTSCPHEAVDERVLEGVGVKACAYHYQHGGTVAPEAAADWRRKAIALVNREAAAAASRIGVDDTKHLPFARLCSGCGTPLFTGNTSDLCSSCFPDPSELVGTVWSIDAAAQLARDVTRR